MRNGIDVGSWQHPQGAPIDYPRTVNSGVSWVAVKCDEGTNYNNPYRIADCLGFMQAGAEVVPYHFAQPGEASARDSAIHFTQSIPDSAQGCERALDLEVRGGKSWAELATWALDFQHYSGCQWLYVNHDFLNHLGAQGFVWPGKLWIAAPSDTEFPAFASAWQYDKGPVPGIAADTDLDRIQDAPPTGDDSMSAEDVAAINAHTDAGIAQVQAELANMIGFDQATGQIRPVTYNPTATDGSSYAGLNALRNRIDNLESLILLAIGYDQSTGKPRPTANTEDGSDVPGGTYAGLVALRRRLDAIKAP